MSNARQRAEEWLMWCTEYGTLKASTRMNTDSQCIIRELLTECERLETEYVTANGRYFECDLEHKDSIAAFETELTKLKG